MGRIVGIDLGTSTSEIAFINDLNTPELINNKNGNIITPSVVYINAENLPEVGEKAKEMAVLEPEYTVVEVKRLMGTDSKINIRGVEYTPQKISSFILSYLKECAEEYLGETVDRAVITVPAYFSDAQRKATVEAGQMAGFTVERIINEPTAASLDYGILHMEDCKNAIIYDLGGGTLDITVLELFEGVIDVKSTCGNNKLGGLDFDNLLCDYLIKECNEKNGASPREYKRSYMRIKNAAEECKIQLSKEESFDIELPFLMKKGGQPIGIDTRITREKFEGLIGSLIESTGFQLRTALKDSGLNENDVDLLLLVGGSTKVPLVSQFIENKLGIEPKSLVDPDLAVVKGAAIQAGIIDGIFGEKGIVITDVCPYTLSIETLGTDFFETYCEPIIKRNTTIPVKKEKIFTTSGDYQSQAKISVYQGEGDYPNDNILLGEFMLSGIPERKARKEKIVVEFSYDLNGILVSKAKAVSTDTSAEITIDMNEISPIEDNVSDVSGWENARSAKKYKAIIKKAEKLSSKSKILRDLIYDFKLDIIEGVPDDELKLIKEVIIDIIYELEDEDE